MGRIRHHPRDPIDPEMGDIPVNFARRATTHADNVGVLRTYRDLLNNILECGDETSC